MSMRNIMEALNYNQITIHNVYNLLLSTSKSGRLDDTNLNNMLIVSSKILYGMKNRLLKDGWVKGILWKMPPNTTAQFDSLFIHDASAVADYHPSCCLIGALMLESRSVGVLDKVVIPINLNWGETIIESADFLCHLLFYVMRSYNSNDCASLSRFNDSCKSVKEVVELLDKTDNLITKILLDRPYRE